MKISVSRNSFWISVCFSLFTIFVYADEQGGVEKLDPARNAAPAVVNSAEADAIAQELPGAEAILTKYSAMKYQENGDIQEAVAEVPFCNAIVERKKQETIELLRLAIGEKQTVARLLDNMDFSFPSQKLLRERTPRMFDQTKTTDQKASPADPAAHTRPTYFSGETLIYRLTKTGENSFEDLTVPLKDIKVGDYILSTTAHLIDDARYQLRCWAMVSGKPESKIPANGVIGTIVYNGKKEDQQELVTSLDPNLNFYARKAGETAFVRMSCQNLKLGMELLSPREIGIDGQCLYAAQVRRTFSGETVMFNLDVALTGAYFVGPLGSQVLVHN